MRYALIYLWLCSPFCSYGQTPNYQSYLEKAKGYYSGKDYPNFYESLKQANQLHPYHQGILYQLGVAEALTNRPEEAINHLTKAVYINADYDLTIPELESLEERADYDRLLELQVKLQTPIVKSDTAFVIKDRELHIESITYNSKTKDFYLGSIHKRKIIKISKNGEVSDFTKAGEWGMAAVFGLKVDARRKFLWACSSPMPEMENYDSLTKSAVFKFDLVTGKLIEKYLPTVNQKEFVFGDLTLTSQGDVFVSDSRNNIIFKVNAKRKTLEPFFQSSEFWNLQGLAFSPDDHLLFIADYIKGPYQLNIQTKQLTKLSTDLKESLKGIDGLAFYNNDLIAIQNGVNPLRVSRLYLGYKQERIINIQILDRKHPAFNEPTIGTIVGDQFYYVANSQWGGYNKDHTLKPKSELQDIIILRRKLNQK